MRFDRWVALYSRLDKIAELDRGQKKPMGATLFSARRPSSGHKEDSLLNYTRVPGVQIEVVL